MKLETLNLLVAWLWILLGFVSGMVLGFFFHREDWWGGYASFRRRMYRLAHISFFGLGAVNSLFWLTVQNLHCEGWPVGVASWAFVVGAVTMPLCCVIMAHRPKMTMIFSVPVVSLLVGGALMLATLLHEPASLPGGAVALAVNRPTTISNFGLGSSDFLPATGETSPADPQLLNPF